MVNKTYEATEDGKLKVNILTTYDLPLVEIYDYDAVVTQINALQAQRDNFTNQLDQRIAALMELKTQAESLGLNKEASDER